MTVMITMSHRNLYPTSIPRYLVLSHAGYGQVPAKSGSAFTLEGKYRTFEKSLKKSDQCRKGGACPGIFRILWLNNCLYDLERRNSF